MEAFVREFLEKLNDHLCQLPDGYYRSGEIIDRQLLKILDGLINDTVCPHCGGPSGSPGLRQCQCWNDE